MDSDILSGPAKVISSGSVFSFGKNPIEIKYLDLKLIMQFEEELDDKGAPIENFSKKSEILDDRTLKLTFINYNSITGIGTKKPIQIASDSEGKKFYLNYIISGSPNRISKNVQYTIYLVGNDNQEANNDARKNACN